MTQLQPNQMMASSLIGTTVVSTNNESIGDINDVLMDRNGQAAAVVIGVGGFLGIGEKDVAVPFQTLDFNAQPQQTSSAGTSGGSAGSSAGMAPSTTGSTAGTPTNTSTATTGNTGMTGTNVGSNRGDANGGVPDRVVLKMTKAELQSAPAFQGASRAGSDSSNNTPGAGAGTSSGSGSGTAPRQ
jgi:sporulation protein YlmC with PRC-barrel domain